MVAVLHRCSIGSSSISCCLHPIHSLIPFSPFPFPSPSPHSFKMSRQQQMMVITPPVLIHPIDAAVLENDTRCLITQSDQHARCKCSGTGQISQIRVMNGCISGSKAHQSFNSMQTMRFMLATSVELESNLLFLCGCCCLACLF